MPSPSPEIIQLLSVFAVAFTTPLFFLPDGMPLVLVIDETLERRRGKEIKYKGWFRDPILSSKERIVKALGIRWICLAALVPVPWSQRPWALPFMTVPALGKKTSAKLNKRHRTIVQWAEYMIDLGYFYLPGSDGRDKGECDVVLPFHKLRNGA